MKFVISYIALIFVFVAGLASAQTAPAKPASVQFNFRAGHIYETIYNVGNEKIVHHWEYMRGEWREDITISSSTMAARKFPISDLTILASGFPDRYEVKNGIWSQMDPPDVPTVVQERYKQYLWIARDLTGGNWPGVFPR